jgi:cytochrome c-type biogenesis protein CcmH/NrfF
VFVNPLINWVWLGCVILMLGTLWCLIPQSLVDLVGRGGRGRTPMGRAGEVAVVLLVAGAAAFGGVRAAYGQAPPGMEHVEQGAGPASHQAGGASASEFRPETAGTPEAQALARRLMKQLVCLCGGCQRETLYDCKCGYAAQEREIVLQLLEGKDLGTSQRRTQAYDDVVAVFVRRYGGEHVLNEPRNQLSWVLPYAAVVGGLLLLFVLGRRWVGRGRAAAAAAPRAPAAAPAGAATDQAYADKLDDELRDVD